MGLSSESNLAGRATPSKPVERDRSTFYFGLGFRFLRTRLYYNGVRAIGFTNLVLRTSETLSDAGGIYFSTFFGGDDAATYATPTEQSLFYKDLQVFGAAEPATGQGEGYKLKNAAQGRKRGKLGVIIGLVAMAFIV
jgi:hypothetical protein